MRLANVWPIVAKKLLICSAVSFVCIFLLCSSFKLKIDCLLFVGSMSAITDQNFFGLLLCLSSCSLECILLWLT